MARKVGVAGIQREWRMVQYKYGAFDIGQASGRRGRTSVGACVQRNRTLEDRYDFGVFVPCIMSCCLAYRVLGTPILISKNQFQVPGNLIYFIYEEIFARMLANRQGGSLTLC
jgi:hypothetical protein